MARYTATWVEIATEQYDALTATRQRHAYARVEQLLENPRRDAYYDARTDQWTTTYGGGIGLIVYAVAAERERVIVLRLV